MNEQLIILISMIIFTIVTIFLYVYKAKNEVRYKKDERWQLIQLKAIKIADFTNYILIVLIAIMYSITLFSCIELTFSLNRVLSIGLIFVGLRNSIECLALLLLDQKY